MTLDYKLRTSLFWMIGIGVQVYCIAEANLTLSLITIPIWLLAWPIAMSEKGKSIPKLVLGTIALGLTVRVFASALLSPEDFVAAISRYIVWLQLLKLFDKREPSDIAQAMALSVFLVLGSCLTSNSMWLGVGLIVYTPAALWGITIYQLFAESHRTHTNDNHSLEQPISKGAIKHLRRLGTGAGIAAAAVAVVVFMLMPRGYGEGFLGDVGVVEPTSVSGVPEEVRLGESGMISTSLAEVLEFSITDQQGNNVGEAIKPVYLKALTLDEYGSGRWRQSDRMSRIRSGGAARPLGSDPVEFYGLVEGQPVIDDYPIYNIRVRFTSSDNARLPTMNRLIRIWTNDERGARTRINSHDVTIFLASGSSLSTYEFQAQPDAPRMVPPRLAERLDWRYPTEFQGTRAHALALEWMDEAGLSRDPAVHVGPDDHQIARIFEARLQNEYAYTLEMIAPEPGEDPIDMFLGRTRAGHCEYFASTLAAMLRSIGMDARVVTGYAATEYDEPREVFVVRENQAHAWVEARTEPNRWRTYDPSPIAEVETAHQGPTGVVAMAQRLIKSANAFWIDHIVGFDRNRQENTLGLQASRLREFFRELWPTPATEAGNDEQMQEIHKAGVRTLIGAAVQVAGLVIGAFGVSVALIILMRRLDLYFEQREASRRRLHEDPEHAIRERQAAFFRRYEKALRSVGLRRSESMPPMTHARSLSSRDAGLARESEALTAIYYRLRFGSALLTPGELDEAERILGRITEALRGAR